MADIFGWKTPGKKQSKKLKGFYLTEGGQTVLMGGTSCDESDTDSAWKVKATTKRNKKSSPEDTITQEEDSNDEKQDPNNEADDPSSSNTVDDDEANISCLHKLPAKGESIEDDNDEPYSGRPRATINIMAEVHSASPLGFISTRSPSQRTPSTPEVGSPGTTPMSPITSPSKNGCVVSREDKIFVHNKCTHHGSPVRQSSRRIQKDTFKKPANPQEEENSSGGVESQLSACLVAGSSIVDSSVSDASISPADLIPYIRSADSKKNTTSVNARKEGNAGKAKSKKDDIVEIDLQDDEGYTGFKEKVTATDKENSSSTEVLNVNAVERDSRSGAESSSKATSGPVIDIASKIGEDSDTLQEIHHKTSKDAMNKTNTKKDKVPEASKDTRSKINNESNSGKTGLKESAYQLDELDILESLLDNLEKPPVQHEDGNDVTGVKAAKGASVSTKQTKDKKNDVTIQEGVGTKGDVQDRIHHDSSFNTSAEDFVPADEMPPQREPLHDNMKSQCGTDHATDSVPCTPPMSPTIKSNHLEELHKSLTKNCQVMSRNTPTPARKSRKIKSEYRKESDADEQFYSLDSGDEEEKRKTVKRKKSQRRKSSKSLAEIMEADDSESDLPICSTMKKKKKRGFTSQFQKFLQLTKDLDDTPSDKGTPLARAADVFQDSPATLLTNQLCSFSLETPVAHQDIDSKKSVNWPKHSARKTENAIFNEETEVKEHVVNTEKDSMLEHVDNQQMSCIDEVLTDEPVNAKKHARRRAKQLSTTQDRIETGAEQVEGEGRKSRRIASKPKVDYSEPDKVDMNEQLPSEIFVEQVQDEGRKSRRIASKPKVDYSESEPAELNLGDLASLDESCNVPEKNQSTSEKKTQRRKSILVGRKRKNSVATEEEVEQLYITRGKTECDPDTVTNDLLETIFESPVSKKSGTPILVSKRRYHRTQTFPEKPWHPRPGRNKGGGRKKRRGSRKKSASQAVDNDELESHLNDILADLSELSPVAKSPKPVMSPFPRSHSQSRLGDTSQDD